MIVVIDPGHGGVKDGEYQTIGKRYSFMYGGDLILQVLEGERMRRLAMFLANELTALGITCRSSLTGDVINSDSWRPSEDDVSLGERVVNANAIDERALFVSLHSNAILNESEGEGQSKASGISIYTSVGETGSDRVASHVFVSLSQLMKTSICKLGMRSQNSDGDPDYEAGFYVLNKTKCPAILIELGFHDNLSDASWLNVEENLRNAAIAIASGISQSMI